MKRTVKRQRTILGVVMREVQRKLDADKQSIAAGGAPTSEPSSPKAMSELVMWLERAERIRAQQRHDKNKLYALHAPEVECIGKVQGQEALRIRCEGQPGRHAQARPDGGRTKLPRQPV